MPGVQPDEGLFRMLKQCVDNLAVSIHLYRNDLTPDRGVQGSQIQEADFSGYAPLVVAPVGLPVVLDHVAVQAWEDALFSHDGGAVANDIYGHYAKEAAGEVLWVERAAGGPFRVAAVPDAVRVRPRFAWASKYPDPCGPVPQGGEVAALVDATGELSSQATEAADVAALVDATGEESYPPPPPPGDFLITEGGDFLITEGGDFLILE